MEQLSLFKRTEKQKGVLIPGNIIAPFESREKLNSNNFNKEREVFLKYIKAIQSYHKCSFIEARQLFYEHRNKEKPIMLDFAYFF